MGVVTFAAGDRVVLRSTGECGVILHSWTDEHGDEDCYIAFFGQHFPAPGQVIEKPYVLRYYAMSLRRAPP